MCKKCGRYAESDVTPILVENMTVSCCIDHEATQHCGDIDEKLLLGVVNSAVVCVTNLTFLVQRFEFKAFHQSVSAGLTMGYESRAWGTHNITRENVCVCVGGGGRKKVLPVKVFHFFVMLVLGELIGRRKKQ